jgi:alpha-L-rhamnosidase
MSEDLEQEHVTQIENLRCEYLVNPLGIDELNPRLSWLMLTSRTGAKQVAYRIRVASSMNVLHSGAADLWDSDWIESDQSDQHEYLGRALVSRETCFWNVEVKDETGSVTLSQPAFWTVGLLQQDDWRASWISADPEIIQRDPDAIEASLTKPGSAAYFRKAFNTADKLKSAYLYVSARGIFEAELNGCKVGDDVFAPEWTDYDKRIHYRCYDVTQLIKQGDNGLGLILGDGWWSGYVGWQEQRGRYGSLQNSVIAQLEIHYENGQQDIISSDDSWRCHTGPIISSDFMMGEVYDARREIENWSQASLHKAHEWLPAIEVPAPEVPLVWQRSEPVKVVQELEPVIVKKVALGRYIFDVGQNISGWVKLNLSKLPEGTELTLRHAERLNPDGSMHVENLRRAKATDIYVCKGEESESWQPRFTFHGFQYVELSGLPQEIEPDRALIKACVVHSATKQVGHFECSHPGVNRLWLNSLWSQKDNFISVPTDCPQRDERLGWTGDAQVFLRTSICNMDVVAFFNKWMIDIEDAQTEEGVFPDTAPRLREDTNFVGLENLGGGAGWADAGVIIPHTLWRVYADRRILQRHYSAMVAWVDWIESHNPNGLRENELANNYGDWLCIPSDTSFGTHSPMKTLLATAFWADDCAKLNEIALELNLEEDAQRFREMFNKIRKAFQREWLLEDGRLSVETQTAYLLALAFDLVPAQERDSAAGHLVDLIREQDWHLNTGFIGVGLLNPQLSLNGFANVAYKLLLQDTYPSWLYPVKNGATTIWERWNGWTEHEGFFNPHMNSFNHYSLGSVGEWLFRFVAGIDCDNQHPGFQKFILCPYIEDGLDFARAHYECSHGLIESHWQKSGSQIHWNIVIPANTQAKVGLPLVNLDQLQLNQKPLTATVNTDAQRHWLRLEAGCYEFSWAR